MEKGSANLACREIRTLYTLGVLGGLTDAQLLELFLERRGIDAEEAFAALVQRHGVLVLSVCRRILPNAHDAEDAFQATFLILVRRAPSIERREQLASWLYGVAVRTAKEARRRAARQQARERRWMGGSQVAPDRVEDQADLVLLLDEELNRLPSHYRAALVACELEGKSRREAALQLGLAEGTLSAHLARGRKLLRERLHRRGVSLGAGPLAGLSRSLVERTVCERLVDSTVRAALGYAAGGISAGAVSATVAELVERVLRTTIMTRLAVLLTAVVTFGLTIAVAWAAVLKEPGEPPTAQAQVASQPNPPTRLVQPDELEAVPRRARVHGIVVDEAGKALPGIRVRANYVVDRQSHGVTDANGDFEFLVRGSELEGVSLLAVSADNARQGIYRYGYGLSASGAKQPVRVVCKPAREVGVHVLNRAGKPVASAALTFLAAKNPVAAGLTDANGHWTALVPADEKDWAVIARKAKVGFDYASAGYDGNVLSLMTLKPLPGQLTLTLDGARTVRIKAVDRNGQPLAGVNVGPSSAQKVGRDWFNNWVESNADLWPATGRDGVAVLDWLPDRLGAGMGLSGRTDGFHPLKPAWIPGTRPVDEATITFLPLERLSGRVIHADGRPASGIQVEASGQGPNDGRVANSWNASTLTDADGRYRFSALSEQVYIVTVHGKEWAAPYRADIVVHPGKPVDGVDFVLAQATRLHGRLTVGKTDQPAPKSLVRISVYRPLESNDIRVNGKSYHPQASWHAWTETDEIGRYEYYLGPGEYSICGPQQRDHEKLTIPAVNPPAEITHDIHETAPPRGGLFAGQVVDALNRPIPGAVVNGYYPVRVGRGRFAEQKADELGRFRTERTHTPLILYARSVDGKLAGVVRIDEDALEGRIVIVPVATASGRVLDLDGKALEQRRLKYGVWLHVDEMDDMPLFEVCDGTAQSDAHGRFNLTGLVPGQTYHVMMERAERGETGVAIVTPKGPELLDLGEFQVDTGPNRPYVPPTPEQRAASTFSAQESIPPRERKHNMLIEARLAHTRPLLLFGQPADAACIDLFVALDERPELPSDQGTSGAKGEPSLLGELRWEFELASFNTNQPGVLELAEGLAVATEQGPLPLLVALSDDGAVAGRFPLRLDKGGKLDRRELTMFLQAQMLAPRNAETMLSDALVKAKAEEKSVFLIFSASWCGPCRRLARFLDSQKVELDRHYVFVKPDMSRDEHAKALRKRYPESKGEGVPWFAILDAEGNVVITSNVKTPYQAGSTNIGFPVTGRGVEHFLKMLDETAPHLHDDKLAELGRALAKER